MHAAGMLLYCSQSAAMQDILTGNRSSSEGRGQPDKALMQEDLIPVPEGQEMTARGRNAAGSSSIYRYWS